MSVLDVRLMGEENFVITAICQIVHLIIGGHLRMEIQYDRE